MVAVLIGALCQGLLWGIFAIGVYITYRILDYADLTAEGSFPLGAAVAATMISTGYDPVISTLVAMGTGILAGIITGFLHTALKIPPLLSGILTMTGLYSINLRILGKANVPLLGKDTVMTIFENMGLSNKNSTLVVGLICVSIVIVILWWFFNTEIGYALRATGNNENMIRALGVNTSKMKVLGLVIGNSLIALSGALVCQFNGYADVGMGAGTIVIGLASVIIGEVVFSDKNNVRGLMAVTLGSIFYRIIIAMVLAAGLAPTDLRLISSILLAIALALPVTREKFSFLSMKQLRGELNA